MTARPDEPIVDPGDLAAKIRDFEALELSDPTEFREALATNILDPDPVETAAFRSDELAFKSYAAARQLIDQARTHRARRRRGSQKQLSTDAFVQNVGRERRILENIVNGIRAKNGYLPAAPNPRRRAEKRLWNLALRGQPVPAEFVSDPRLAAEIGAALKALAVALHQAEEQKDRDRKREQKKARKAQRQDRA